MHLTLPRIVPYEVPFKRPYVSASVVHETRKGFLFRIETTRGDVGLGEAAPLGSRSESLAEAGAALEAAARALADADPGEVLGELDRYLPELGDTPTARYAVTLALCDLEARRAGTSLARFLRDRWHVRATGGPDHAAGDGPTGDTAGGTAGDGDVPSTVPVNATVPSHAVEETVSAARAAVDRGFSTIKLKVGATPATDLERITAVREAVGDDVHLRLDANQAWERDTAAEQLNAFAPLGIEYVEQPVHAQDLSSMSWLRSTQAIAIAADEPVRDRASLERVLEMGAADVVVLKPMVLGGPDRAIELARLAEAAGVDVVVTSTIDGAVGRTGALHTAAALGKRPRACGLATGGLLARDIAHVDERIENGHMHVPRGPGLGITELTVEGA